MEKRRQHYALASMQAQVAVLGAAAFTKTALDGGRAMGLTTADMLGVIAALARSNFYKSMTTYADHRVWQDVYRAMTPVGRTGLHQADFGERASGRPVQGAIVMKQCPECGKRASSRFTGETMTVEYAGLQSVVAGLSGWRCNACGEVLFDADSAARYAAAGDALVVHARDLQRHEIRRIRRKLGLSQAKASALTGGGPNAFSRYELGKAKPLPAVTNLLLLLDRHPELLHELTPS